MLPYDSVPFKNKIDQVIQPNDPIVIVTKSTGNVHVGVGRYLGSRGTDKNLRVVVVEERTRNVWRSNADNSQYEWDLYDKIETAPKYTYPESRTTYYGNYRTKTPEDLAHEEKLRTEQRNTYEEYRKAHSAYAERKTAWLHANYTLVTEGFETKSTLQLNRIFKIDTSVRDISKVPL